MLILGWVAALALVGVPDTAADVITLRDGSVLLGQVVENSARGKVSVVVRRAWAEKKFPQKFRAWKTAEAGSLQKAKTDRLRRLEEWKRERDAGGVEKSDNIGPWLESERDRLKANADTPPLMLVTLNKADVKTITKRNADTSRKLRQAWRGGFDDAENKTLAAMTTALEGRGFAMSDVDPAPIDTLLPLPVESENRWKARRAATEVGQDRGLRYIQAHGMVMPEPSAGEAPDPKELLGGLLKNGLGMAGEGDSLADAKKTVGERGRIGFVLTQLTTDEDLGGVKLVVTLYVRTGRDQWEPAVHRESSVRASDVRPNDASNIGEDPQVKGIFKGIEGLGIEIPAELKQNGLMIGAATQKAIAEARTSIQPDLDALALPIDATRNAK